MEVSVFCPFAGSTSVTKLVILAGTIDVTGSPAYTVNVLVMTCVEKTVGSRIGATDLSSCPSSPVGGINQVVLPGSRSL